MTNGKEQCIIVTAATRSASQSLPFRIYAQVESITRTGVCNTKMSSFFPMIHRNTVAAVLTTFLSAAVSAQSNQPKIADTSSDSSWLWIVLVALLVAVGAFLVWRKFQGGQPATVVSDERVANYYNSHETYEMDGLDVDKELEWLRKTRKPASKTLSKTQAANTKKESPEPVKRAHAPIDLDTKAFQERMRKMQYAQLPINSFTNLTEAKLYEPLPLSEDPSLLSAIEQADEEFEEDEAVRELALKILTAFRTRNSVEALTQIALYDLSSNLRSKAVSTLTDFDHPSVFEPILLACADPTREVRAAAARGLFRLSFNRSDAWKRLTDTNDEFRMNHAARAAIESGIAVKSFERLVHEDLKVAYEAFSLVAFMIAAGETEEIFKAIRSHRDERVKFALLHMLKVMKDPRTLDGLEKLKMATLTPDVAERLKDTIANFEKVLA